MRILATAAALAGVALVFAVSGDGHKPDPRTRPKSSSVAAARSPFGTILFDGRGFVLYAFTKDTRGRSACAGACAKAWPPYIVTGKLLGRDAASLPPGSARSAGATVHGKRRTREGRFTTTSATASLARSSVRTSASSADCGSSSVRAEPSSDRRECMSVIEGKRDRRLSRQCRERPVIRLFGPLSIESGERTIGPGDLGASGRSRCSRSFSPRGGIECRSTVSRSSSGETSGRRTFPARSRRSSRRCGAT